MSQEFLLKMAWIPLSKLMNLEGSKVELQPMGTVLPSLSTYSRCVAARKDVGEHNTIYYRNWSQASIWHRESTQTQPAGGITVTVWLPPAGKGLPSGACLCTLPVAALITRRSVGTWRGFILSAVKMAWMQLSPSLKIANLTESVGHRDLHLSFNVSVTHKWIESKFNS